jgi:threonine dehydrogenase-like Zn-dependent dehydrogenase
VVDQIGAEVQGFAEGDLVVAPFTVFATGRARTAVRGDVTLCRQRLVREPRDRRRSGRGRSSPIRAEHLRSGPGHRSLARDDAITRGALSDVMSTGHHVAVSAGVHEGSVVGVVGDGAVGLCAVLAARKLGAET